MNEKQILRKGALHHNFTAEPPQQTVIESKMIMLASAIDVLEL